MYFNINELVERELNDIYEMIKTIESRYEGRIDGSIDSRTGELSEQEEKDFLKARYTKAGVIYDKRVTINGKRITVKLGGADNKEVIWIKQKKFDEEMLHVLKRNRKLLEKVSGKLLPYDPDSIDELLDLMYRDQSGLVNKASAIVEPAEWYRIIKRNDYPLPDDCNMAPDGMKTRSKSELIIYSIIKGYRVVFKYDMEIVLRNDAGEIVKVCPDFIILCNDGSMIIIEHLGKLDNDDYLANALKRIHLYLINGYKLNETLFLTADSMSGKINAEAVDELIRKMILPKARRY